MNAGRRYLWDPDFVYRRIVDEVILLPIINSGSTSAIVVGGLTPARIP